MIVLIQSFFTPYSICFSDESEHFVQSAFDNIPLSIDIVINFFTNNSYTFNFRQNSIDYITTWFIFDIVSILPIDLLFKHHSINLYLVAKLPKLLRTVKLLQEKNIHNCLERVINTLKLNRNVISIIKLLFSFFYFNHLFACLFYLLARIRHFDYTTWIYHKGLLDRSNLEIYIWCLYWNLTTVTSVGYGNISAFSWEEKVYSIIIISIGVVMYSSFIGNFSVIISAMNERENELRDKLHELDFIWYNYTIERDTYNKVKKEIKYQTYKIQNETKHFVNDLPKKLKVSLIQIINDRTIQKIYWLKNNNVVFTSSVIPLLHPMLMFQNDCLYQYNDVMNNSKTNFLNVYSVFSREGKCCLSNEQRVQ